MRLGSDFRFPQLLLHINITIITIITIITSKIAEECFDRSDDGVK
jgi:hypothetical protein